MKSLVTPLSISIIVLALTACNDKTENIEQAGEVEGTPSQTEITMKKPVDRSNETTDSEEATTLDKAEKNKAPMKPINLDDFRSAIDDVVQDSIQESVENAVEDAVSKKSK